MLGRNFNPLKYKLCHETRATLYNEYDDMEDACFAQNVFPEETVSTCTITVPEAASYEIDDFEPSGLKSRENCTLSLSYSVNDERKTGILKTKSQSVHTTGANLVLVFDSGCTWSGAMFQLRVKLQEITGMSGYGTAKVCNKYYLFQINYLQPSVLKISY